MQKYLCHKTVEAFKIARIVRGFGGQTILYESDAVFVPVGEGYMHKHNPTIGGYYVRYEDGYESFSPASVFEAGYNLIEEDQ